MRILLKCPTRSRPQKIFTTLRAYMKFANHPEQLGVAISCDESDTTMSRNLVHEEIHSILQKTAWHAIYTSENTTKIQACNADMEKIPWEWDILVLISDDMIPRIQGYDDVIRTHMMGRFPDTNGILWYNDGFQGNNLNTLSIMGRAMYNQQGYIYNPEYKSLFCDTEFTDLCKGTLATRCLYIPYCIIRHEHPGTGFAQEMDALYQKNQQYWNEDMHTYIRRKTYSYDWSVLIPTIPGRETSLHRLLSSLHEKRTRICPDMRMEICLSFDNREASIGTKREGLLQQACGKYMSFIDDDDEITDAYIEDLYQTIQGGYHTMRLQGDIQGFTFVHSLRVSLSGKMASAEGVFQRPPNHLNPMLSDVAKLIHFKDALCGEDLDWTLSLAKRKYLETEYKTSRTHYLYNLDPRKQRVTQETVTLQQNTTYETMLQMVFTPNKAVQPTTRLSNRLVLGPRGFLSK